MCFPMYSLMDWKALSHFSLQVYSFIFFNIWKNGRHFFLHLDIKWLSATILQFNYWTSWMHFGGRILISVATLSRLASIPIDDTIYHKKFPDIIPKTHFIRLRCNSKSLRMGNTSSRFKTWHSTILFLNIMSST